jgi:hypothetical protein
LDVVLAFTAPAQIAVSQANFSVVNNSTVSPSVTRVGNGYTYCVKPAAQACLDADYSDLLNGTGPIPSPAAVVPPNYWLRIRYNYTIAGITQPPAQWTPSALGVSDNTAWPFTVSSQIPEIRFNCTVGFGCTDVGKITVNAGDVFTAYAYVNGGQDNSTSISWSAPGASQGDGSTSNPVTLSYSTAGTYTLTLNGYGAPYPATITVMKSVTPPAALSVSASANPSSATTGTLIGFSCSASGGTPAYTYSWSGAVSGSSSGISQTFSTAGSYSATCTVTDAASHTASATAFVSISNTVEIRFNCTVGFGCTDVGSITVNTTDIFTAYAYVSGGQYAGAMSWSAPGASQGNGSTQNGQTFSYSNAGTYTLTLTGPGTVAATITVKARATPLSVSASANPSSATMGTTITFSCSASGGTPAYTYSWSGAVSGSISSIYQAFSTAGSYSATCTVTDAASHTASATAYVSISNTVEIRFNCTVGFGCTDVGSITVNAGDVFTAYAYVNGSQDNSTSISWSAPGASQGDGSTQNGAVFRYSTEGTYTLTLNGYGSPVNATVHVTFTLPPGSEGPYSLFILDPCRVLDTRNPVGPLGGPAIQPAGTPDRTLAVGSFCGIPFDAKAISANVTVTNVLAMGVVSIYRGDGQPTGTNTVALAAGRTRANNAILQLALDGSGTIKVQNTSSGTLDLIIDVNGYFR